VQLRFFGKDVLAAIGDQETGEEGVDIAAV